MAITSATLYEEKYESRIYDNNDTSSIPTISSTSLFNYSNEPPTLNFTNFNFSSAAVNYNNLTTVSSITTTNTPYVLKNSSSSTLDIPKYTNKGIIIFDNEQVFTCN